MLKADAAALPAAALGAAVLEMVDDAMAAYADEDIEACFAIDTRDDEIDAMCQEASGAVVRDLVENDSAPRARGARQTAQRFAPRECYLR